MSWLSSSISDAILIEGDRRVIVRIPIPPPTLGKKNFATFDAPGRAKGCGSVTTGMVGRVETDKSGGSACRQDDDTLLRSASGPQEVRTAQDIINLQNV